MAQDALSHQTLKFMQELGDFGMCLLASHLVMCSRCGLLLCYELPPLPSSTGKENLQIV